MPPLLNMTTSVKKVTDWLSLNTKLQPYFNVNGMPGEPGLTICTNAQQMLLSDIACAFKFNRGFLSGPPLNPVGNFFITQYGVIDYRHAGSTAFTLFNQYSTPGTLTGTTPAGGVGIDLATNPIGGGTSAISVSGGIVTVQSLQQNPFQVGQTVYMSGNTLPAYNSTFVWTGAPEPQAQWSNGWVITAVPDGYHFQFAATAGQNDGDKTGAPGLTDWGWGESAYIVDPNSLAFPQPNNTLDMVRNLPVTYYADGDVKKSVCLLSDFNNGVLLFRISEPFGTYPLQINIIYQKRAPVLTSPESIVAWPDNLSHVFQEVALWYAMRFATGITSADTQAQWQIANLAIKAARDSDDREDNSQGLIPTRSFFSY